MGTAWDVYSLAHFDFYVSSSMLYFWRNWKSQLSINDQIFLNLDIYIYSE